MNIAILTLVFGLTFHLPARAVGVFDHSHVRWNQILAQHVVLNGAASTFRYANLKSHPADLDSYLATLSKVDKSTFNSWTKNQQMAFLINAYNAFTVKLIIENYPVSSIKKIGGWFGSPWKKKFFKLFGEDYYLDRIEHEQLRPIYKDPRVHFAVNCASIGCPRLRPEAYRAEALDAQLNDQAQLFLSDTSRNYIESGKRTIYLSKIFDWFKEDFKPSPREYVAPLLNKSNPQAGELNGFQVKFLEYDWNLNDVKVK